MRTPERAALAALGILCASNLPAGEDMPIAQLAEAPCLASIEEAVRAAFAVALPLSAKVEFGGVVVEVDGRYCFTTPVAGTQTQVRYRVSLTDRMKVVAIYHTHPKSAPMRERSRFSERDAALADQRRVPSYLGVAGTEQVRVYRPGTYLVSR